MIKIFKAMLIILITIEIKELKSIKYIVFQY